MKKVTLLLAAFLFSLSALTCEAAEKSQTAWTFVQATYTVQKGDTLESIARVYMAKNTYGKRELKEFEAGIKELNDWLLQRELRPGDELRINYWKKA